MKKKIILFLMVFAALISIRKVNAKNIITDKGFEITNEEVNRLKNIGFSEEQIYAMEESVFNENKNLTGRVLERKSRFYKTTIVYNNNNIQTNSLNNNFKVINEEISEEEYNSLSVEDNSNSLNNYYPGTTSTTFKKLTSSIIQVGDIYRLKADLEWKNMPKQRSSDILTLAHNDLTSPIPSSNYFQQIWIYDNPCQNSSQRGTSSDGSWKITKDFYGKVFTLPSDKTCSTQPSDPLIAPTIKAMKITSLSSYMYYNINKITSPIHVIDAYADYAHATKKVDLNTAFNFGFDGNNLNAGISFSPSIETSYDEMNTAHTSWDGLNW